MCQTQTWTPSEGLAFGLSHRGTGAMNSPSLLWCKPINVNRAPMESQQAHNGGAKRWGMLSTLSFSLGKAASVNPRQQPTTGGAAKPTRGAGRPKKQRFATSGHRLVCLLPPDDDHPALEAE